MIYSIDKLLEPDSYNINLLRENPKLVSVMGNYIFDGSVDVRSTTKEIFINVYGNNNKGEV